MFRKILYFVILTSLLVTCRSGDQRREAGLAIPDSILNEGLEISEEVMQNIVQNISSPVEMAALIKDLGVEYSNRYISPTDRVDDLATSF